MATAADLGDQTAPAGSIHPRNKTILAARLAASSLAITYGKKVPYLGPQVFQVVQRDLSERERDKERMRE